MVGLPQQSQVRNLTTLPSMAGSKICKLLSISSLSATLSNRCFTYLHCPLILRTISIKFFVIECIPWTVFSSMQMHCCKSVPECHSLKVIFHYLLPFCVCCVRREADGRRVGVGQLVHAGQSGVHLRVLAVLVCLCHHRRQIRQQAAESGGRPGCRVS